MTPVTVPSAHKTAADLGLAESRRLVHRDHCKPRGLLQASGVRAGGVSEAVARSACRELM